MSYHISSQRPLRAEVQGILKTLKLPAESKASLSLEERLPKASADCLDLLKKLLDKIPTRRIGASAPRVPF